MRKDDRRIQNQFVNELVEWSKNGEKPKSGNQDIAYFLELQKDRLEERNLQMELDVRMPKEEADRVSGKMRTLSSRQSEKYEGRTDYYQCERETTFYREEKKVFSKKRVESLYVTTTDLKSQKIDGTETYCCPDCGAISTIQELQEGCPYCKTKFIMSDLFPKVTDFYYLRNNMSVGSLKKYIVVCMVLCCIVTNGISISYNGLQENLILAILQIVLVSAMSCVPGYIVAMFPLFFYMLGKAIACIPALIKHVSAKSTIVRVLAGQDPNFSYDYFMNQLLSTLKMVLFTTDRNNLAVYEGKAPHPEFDDIIEATYMGTLGMRGYKVENGYCTMCLDLPMLDIHDRGDKVSEKKDVFRVTICKNISKPEEMGFSIKKVQCKNCGGSFDATREKYCPYCQTPYDLKEDAWVITEIEKVK